MYRLASSVLTIGLFVVLAFGTGPAGAQSTVIDGGTMMIDGQRIRLWGIEAPVPGRECTTSAGVHWPCGDRAREQLAQAVAEDDVTCEAKGDGQVICRVGGLDLGLLLVKEGLAWSRGGYGEAEARAKDAKVGVWE